MTTATDVPGLEATAAVDDSRALPRHLVHRQSIAEVFLTAASPSGAGLRVNGQWPRSNRFHLSTDASRYDELLAFETFRQGCILAGHTGLHVSMGHRFVMTSARLDFAADAMAVGPTPADVRMSLTWTASTRHAFVVDALIDCDGRPAARGRGEMMVIDPRAYVRLRGERAAATAAPPSESDIAPRQVGRHFTRDVLLTRAEHCEGLLLRVDPRHPVHFDHTHDHVPGMALIDAARQAGRLVHPVERAHSIQVDFHSFVELDEPCEVRPRATPQGSSVAVTTTFVQGGQVRARALVVSPTRAAAADAAG